MVVTALGTTYWHGPNTYVAMNGGFKEKSGHNQLAGGYPVSSEDPWRSLLVVLVFFTYLVKTGHGQQRREPNADGENPHDIPPADDLVIPPEVPRSDVQTQTENNVNASIIAYCTDDLQSNTPNSIEVIRNNPQTDILPHNNLQNKANQLDAMVRPFPVSVTVQIGDQITRLYEDNQVSGLPHAKQQKRKKRKRLNRSKHVGHVSSKKEYPTALDLHQRNTPHPDTLQSKASNHFTQNDFHKNTWHKNNHGTTDNTPKGAWKEDPTMCPSPERTNRHDPRSLCREESRQQKPGNHINCSQKQEKFDIFKATVVRCDDNEKAFSEPRHVTSAIERPNRHTHFSIPDIGIETSDLLLDRDTFANIRRSSSFARQSHPVIHDDKFPTAGFPDTTAKSHGQRVAHNKNTRHSIAFQSNTPEYSNSKKNTFGKSNLDQDDITQPKATWTENISVPVCTEIMKGGQNPRHSKGSQISYALPGKPGQQSKPHNGTRANAMAHSSNGACTTTEPDGSMESKLWSSCAANHDLSNKKAIKHSNFYCRKIKGEVAERRKDTGINNKIKIAKLMDYLSENHVDRDDDWKTSISLPTYPASHQIPPQYPGRHSFPNYRDSFDGYCYGHAEQRRLDIDTTVATSDARNKHAHGHSRRNVEVIDHFKRISTVIGEDRHTSGITAINTQPESPYPTELDKL
ncbi:uncharacterized protein LOC135477778 [Liolophura sinensis]|uniref:uncharacterized protein LOC135477778 n=1 Tax=Liolophura sinensis TaxID=3198878 RepID=UPI00315931C6